MTSRQFVTCMALLASLSGCGDEDSAAPSKTDRGDGSGPAPVKDEAAQPTMGSGAAAAGSAGPSGTDPGDPGASGAPGSGPAAKNGPAADPSATAPGAAMAANPYAGFTSQIYADDKLWMCKPGLAKNYCLENIADATEALPDGSFQPFMDQLSTDHSIDCIFWYPTVNRTEDPTSLDFSDPAPMLGSIRSQAARFSRVCNVYAPFYRQVSLNNGGDRELGYSDVVDSFKQYISHWNQGRDFVIYGHSQGTGHATRLIREEVDGNPELRGRLISTLLIGGGIASDSFENIPLCERADQFGCVVGYRTYGQPSPPTGTVIPATQACVNPAALGGGSALLKGSFFVSLGSNYAPALGENFPAHFGLFRNFFSGECKSAPSGGQYLEIAYARADGDPRAEFLDLSREIGGGLHVFDYNFLIDDLIELVRVQADAKAKTRQP